MIVIMAAPGFLGNRTWVQANVLALAAEAQIPVVHPAFELFPYFKEEGTSKLTTSGVMSRAIARWVPMWLWRKIYSVNLRTRTFICIDIGESGMFDLEADPDLIRHFERSGLVFLSGYFLSATGCMERQRERLRQFFSLRPEYERRKANLICRARGDGDILIGVHIRQGDYRTYCDGLMFYTTAEYVEVMASLTKQLPDRTVRFLICSNERQPLSAFEGLDVLMSDEIPVVDMYALACCDYIVGPNSSFSSGHHFMVKFRCTS